MNRNQWHRTAERNCDFCGQLYQARIDPSAVGRSRYCSRRCSARKKPAELRFRERLAPPNSEGCVLWLGATLKYGHGIMRGSHGAVVLVHRLAWELANGPIPEGMSVCHHCDIPACCNIEHLFLGTHAANMADRDAKKRGKLPVTPLTLEQVHDVRERYAVGGLSFRQVAIAVAVTPQTVANIIQRRNRYKYL